MFYIILLYLKIGKMLYVEENYVSPLIWVSHSSGVQYRVHTEQGRVNQTETAEQQLHTFQINKIFISCCSTEQMEQEYHI